MLLIKIDVDIKFLHNTICYINLDLHKLSFSWELTIKCTACTLSTS